MRIVLTFDCERDWFPGAIDTYRFPYCEKPVFSQLEAVMPQIVSLCRKHDARATFFVTGEAAEGVSLFRSLPFEIGVHTHPSTHYDLSVYPVEEFRRRDSLRDYPKSDQRRMIAADIDKIHGAAGYRPRSFRAGALCCGDTTQEVLRELGIEANSSYRYGVNLLGWRPFIEAGVLQVPTYSLVSAQRWRKWSLFLSRSRALRWMDTSLVLLVHPNEFALEPEAFEAFGEFLAAIRRYGFAFAAVRDLVGARHYKGHEVQSINRTGQLLQRAVYAAAGKRRPAKSGQDEGIAYDTLIWHIRRGGDDVVLSHEYLQAMARQGQRFVYTTLPINDTGSVGFIFGSYRRQAAGLLTRPITVGELFGESLAAASPDMLQNVLSSFEDKCRRNGIPEIVIYTKCEGFGRFGYKDDSTHTLIVNIAQEDTALLFQMDTHTRRQTRKSLQGGATVEEAQGSKLFDVFHAMRVETMKRSSKGAEDRSFYDSVGALITSSQARLLLVRTHEGDYVAGGLFYFNNDTVYFWKGASLQAGWPIRASNLLHWRLMQIARDAGFKRYNMVGADLAADSSTAGITRFKAGWGGELVPVHVYRKVLSATGRRAFAAARAVRNAGRGLTGNRRRGS
ncbi:MAG: peptidoglycan bridge formation glycyltransferase FemA/FemB family protein [Phycisphaerae bacterium]|nr:peptidoglycan bridge formation glycyltransferase FemA/FemB family protein [Phycisphaerae bacterium]